MYCDNMSYLHFNFNICLHYATERTTIYKGKVYMGIYLYNGYYAPERTIEYNDKMHVTSICTIVRAWCEERGSNTWPSDLSSNALPTELSPQHMEWPMCSRLVIGFGRMIRFL